MPIEFRCPACNKLLRTPDQSAGKKAKCPQCGAITDVPAEGSASSSFGSTDTTEDFPHFPDPLAADTSPSNPFAPDKFAPSPLQSTSEWNPYASPAQVSGKPSTSDMPAGGPGLPWEHGKSAKSFWETVKMVFSTPTIAFATMRPSGGFGDPILFAIAGGLAGGLFSAIYNSLLQAGILAVAGAQGGEEAAMLGGMIVFQVIMQFVAGIAGGTVGVVIGCFIAAALQHVCLMILGERTLNFETTFRVGAFATGATSLLQVVPLCGAYVYGLVGMVYTIIGLAAAHRISTGKSAAAVLLPLLVCLAIIFIFAAVMFGIIAATAARDAGPA